MSSVIIKVTNNGVTEDGKANMAVKVSNCRPIWQLNSVYFLAAINAMRDTDEEAFMNALEAFFKHELEQDDDEE